MARPEVPFLLANVDELVLEYLLFRGFTKTFQTFAHERKKDRCEGLDVDKLVHQIFLHIKNTDLERLMDLWNFLDARFFCHLDSAFSSAIARLRTALERSYIVHVVQSCQPEKAIAFFKQYASTHRHSNAESAGWQPWFMLPYMSQPETDPYFRDFFSSEWLDNLALTLRNFLSTVFQGIPLPKLLAFQIAQTEEPTLRLQLESSRAECHQLRLDMKLAYDKIKRAEASSLELRQLLQIETQKQFSEHLIESPPPSSSVLSDTTVESTSLALSMHDTPRTLALSPNHKYLAIAGAEHELIFCATNPLAVVDVPALTPYASRIAHLTFLSDSTHVLIGLESAALWLVSVSGTARTMKTTPACPRLDAVVRTRRKGGAGPRVTMVLLASSSVDGGAALELYDATDDAIVQTTLVTEPIEHVCVTDNLIVTAHRDVVTIYDVLSLTSLSVLSDPTLPRQVMGLGTLEAYGTIFLMTQHHVMEFAVDMATWSLHCVRQSEVAPDTHLLATSEDSFLISSARGTVVQDCTGMCDVISSEAWNMAVWDAASASWWGVDSDKILYRLPWSRTLLSMQH
ncbi:hypothetical protein SPRG_00656 [Saprolegnia parasitica CBS 223.65]|uniref:ARMC9 CTLH-like domain-containing protein n=1 Tax=Saprolegnia parasitica (strain CBS 223.65) TaxID=695850 RepID=A0A067CVQ9_SAPPC|nr:hypothetical protein SPRG_00656 [Saprolegnia parasitica CBS 223.65]KDO34593.1 hypothetical protein SPRG_00656 [Saprolegnia parasitica CBS 223.65]|eukprot:XP_012194270.1 hypothetical protein SPRG_00656 [Saprolegnia parasitica CBS 223.65]